MKTHRRNSTIRSTARQKKKRTCKVSVLITVLTEIGPVYFVLPGEYKIILLLVGVLSRGKVAKRLADRAIDLMEDVQNLRRAIYPYVSLGSTIDF